MTDGAVGITFQEQMKGGFALGASDPSDGQRKGRASGQELTLHAEVAIDDVRRFRDDPQHAGSLAGTVDFAPLGSGLAGRNGVFNLFSPTDQPGLKLMVYELGFQSGGKDYYLAGAKQVHKDTGFDLWSDTTTLFTRLHQGKDKSGPVVGAGILTLGVGDLLKLTSTIRTTNAKDPGQSVQAIAEFTEFFLGELADSYLKPVPADSRKPGV
jgi:cholesterol oxidase